MSGQPTTINSGSVSGTGTGSNPPKTLYCLKCKARNPVKNISMIKTQHVTKKNHCTIERATWKGECSNCGKNVSQFAKKESGAFTMN